MERMGEQTLLGAHEIIRSDRGSQNSQKAQEKGTRKIVVVVIVPNEENVRMDFIVGARNYSQRQGLAEFAECTEKSTRKLFVVAFVPNEENVRNDNIGDARSSRSI